MLRSLRAKAPSTTIERAAQITGPSPWQWDLDPNLSSLAFKYQPLALPAFYRGVRTRSGIICTLPLAIEVGGQVQDFLPPIIAQPDPTEDRQETLSRMATSLAMRGEFVALLGDFDEDGFPNSLKVIDPYNATKRTDGTWDIRIGDVPAQGRNVPNDQILHRMALAFAGETRGMSVVELFRRQLEGELSAQVYQGQFYKDGGLPMAVVSTKSTDLDETQLSKLASTWREKVRRSREPVFLPGDFTVTPLYLSNRDSQYLESRTFSLTDVANMVGLPPYFVGASGSSNTYSNITDQRRDLIDIYLRDDLYLIERAFTSLMPEGIDVKYQAESFLRLDPKATAETLKIESSWMTLNEVRAVQGLPPLPGELGNQLASLYQPGAAAQPSSQGTNDE